MLPFDTSLHLEAGDTWASRWWRESSPWKLQRSERWRSIASRWRQRALLKLSKCSPWRRTWPLWPRWTAPVSRNRDVPDEPPTKWAKLRDVSRCGETKPARTSSRHLRTSGSRRSHSWSRFWCWALHPIKFWHFNDVTLKKCRQTPSQESWIA